MKTKITYCVTSFIVALSLAIAFVSITKNTYFFKKNDPQAQAKIYNFLLRDKDLLHEMSEKMIAVPVPERIGIIKDYYVIREKQDLSGLPEDFRFAWEKKILNDVEWANFIYHLRNFNGKGIIKTEAQKEIINEKIAESRKVDYELISVSESYGLEFDEFGWLIEKK